MAGKGWSPGMKVFERADEAVRQEQRRARSLVEISDPPAVYVKKLDVLRAYSPVSIWARCSRPE
jgi:hypothetical protein